MSNHISHASLPYPIKHARFTLLIPYLDADGDPTDPTTPDTEVSQDGGSFADATEEMSTITGSNGMGYITLTGAETNNSAVGVACKVASGPKNTLATLYPRELPILANGTASAGASGSITLASSITYDITGCFVRTTGGTGGGGTGGANNQARRITAYNTSTQVATVLPAWETTPDNTTTYDVLCPEGVTIGMLKALNPTTAGNTLDVSSGGEAGLDWANIGSKTTTNALTGTTIASTQKVDVDTIKTNAVVNGGTVTFPTNATLASTTNITAGTITTVTTVTNQLTAAQIATGVWQDTTSGDFTVSSSIGKSLYTSGNAPGASSGLAIVGSNMGTVTSVSGAVGSISGVSFPSNFSAIAITAGGIVKADIQTILATAVTEGGSGRLAGAFTTLLNVASPVLTTASVNQTGDSYARIGANGVSLSAIPDEAGVTTLLSRLTSTRAGYIDNLSAGAVALASGVTVTTNNDKTGYGLSSAAVQAIWDALTSALTTVGSIGKLLVDNINATISSRLASASYTAPLDAAGTRSAVGLGSANLDSQLSGIQADLPQRITKNTALAGFVFLMVDSSDHVTPKTGLTITATRSLDGAAFASCANSVSEISNGFYKIDLAAGDLNGNVVALKFTATGADQRSLTIVTEPT